MDKVHHLGSWRELYVLLGTSSATLVGLLFVAASLHLREIVNDAIYKVRAQDTMLLLVATLVQAAAILTPQPINLVGIELFIINLGGLWFPVHLLLQAARVRTKRRRYSIYRMAFFVTSHAIGLIGSAALIADAEWGLYLITASYVSCLIGTIWNAWNIMLGIGQTENKRAR